ncbi:hypothetical protein GOZ80_15675 [Agrobacterium vitis]|uniref:Uncharacterized protein n=1 Tax=Agrobacterium vitis TaxID=373 RepID=A0ABD6GD96_AGRVI|nr:hypothetical protein [Agrobacterium vitis]MUP05828.1 hypothetical protein [Agrobacterium vitis]MVA93450.1 hypothetical protein [Agrobacterium vitis]MVB02276.1 hypothetical protein [Agrobacterium vitis]NSY11223.1 hypothetical protein [Agrobacterium vitis]WEO72261.1 hypothetical protein G6L01_002625 [Agrobacterium vitis]
MSGDLAFFVVCGVERFVLSRTNVLKAGFFGNPAMRRRQNCAPATGFQCLFIEYFQGLDAGGVFRSGYDLDLSNLPTLF